ncbi:FAD-binding oxidoreductase [Balneolales bacterium ANBcel1]|nr:FAD-binding oxidoreductase [Balneolales bacterium ANBcel1]
MNNYDIIIIGGGLAGLATAAHLIEHKKNPRILVYDALEIGKGASAVPGGMVNPITGQRANVAWRAESGMQLLEQRLKILSTFEKRQLHLENGVLRPAIDEELSHNFRKAFKQGRWPKDWVIWMSPEEVTKKHPLLKSSYGALFLSKGKVIDTPAYLEAYKNYLSKQGVDIETGGPYQLEYDGQWVLDNRSKAFSAPRAVIATGYKSRENKFWTDLPLNSVKGQLAVYECSRPVDTLPAVSAYGYIAPLVEQKLVVGSTYEHHFHDDSPDKQSARLLDQKLEELLPELYSHCKSVQQWSGIRATTPDRLPIVGHHPEHEHLFIYAGLGSKGLLYSEVVGKMLADHLLTGQAIPKEISLYRFSKYRELRRQALEAQG